MADEAGGLKPGNFYVGVVELFAILLPGAVLTYLAWELHLEKVFAKPPLCLRPPDGMAGYIAFAVCAYVAGHFLAGLGYSLMQPFFDPRRTRRYVDLLNKDEERARAAISKVAELGKQEELFRWAVAYLEVHSAEAAGRLDVLEADCKFFRNLIPVLFLSFPLIDVAYSGWFIGTYIETLGIGALLVYQTVPNLYRRYHGSSSVSESWLSKRTASLRWLAGALLIPVLLNVILTYCLRSRNPPTNPHTWLDIGLYMITLLAIARYMGLQAKRMRTAYEYLSTVTWLSNTGSSNWEPLW